MPFPDFDPVLVHIGPLAIRWYALAYVAGILLGWRYATALLKSGALWRRRPPPATTTQLDDLILWITLGVIVGGRLGHTLFYTPELIWRDPAEILKVWHGGMSFHGGALGVLLALSIFAWRNRLDPLRLGDLIAAATPIGLFFGRIANFINGELWGRPAPDFPYAIVFPHGGPVPRHPSQLYEAFAEGVLLFVVLAVAVRRFGFRRPGLVGGLFVLGYAVARIVCEFFREPDPQLGFLFGRSVEALGGGITMGMLLSLPMAVVGLAIIVLAARGLTQPRTVAEAAGS